MTAHTRFNGPEMAGSGGSGAAACEGELAALCYSEKIGFRLSSVQELVDLLSFPNQWDLQQGLEACNRPLARCSS